MNFLVTLAVLTSSSHLIVSATDFLSAMNFSGYLSGSDFEQLPYSGGDGFLITNEFSSYLSGSDFEQSPYSVGDGFLISNQFFWLPSEVLTSSNHLLELAKDFLSAMNFLIT